MKSIFSALVLVLVFASCSEKKSAETSDQAIEPEKISQQTNQNTAMENTTDTVVHKVRISTSFGDMVAILYNETPKHRDNFLKLTKEGYYDGLLFHRVISSFMIQGGDPDSKNAKPNQDLGGGGPGYTIPAEFRSNLIHKKGALAAARMGDRENPTKASSGSQFYIVQGKKYSNDELSQIESSYQIILTDEQKKIYREIGGTPFLDYNYTVFGEVISGLDVIDKIAAVQTNSSNRPLQDIKMKVTIEE